MADKTFSGGAAFLEKAVDNGDGSFSRQMATSASAADRAAASGTFRRAAAVGATPGDALFVTGVTTAGTITVTLVNGGTLTINVPLGSSFIPVGVTAAALGTAVGGSFQSVFFT